MRTLHVPAIVISFKMFGFGTLFFFFSISDVHQPLSQIRISLAGSLGAGQTRFLAGIGAKDYTVIGLTV